MSIAPLEKRLHALLQSKRQEDHVAAVYLANHLLERCDLQSLSLSAARRVSLSRLVLSRLSAAFVAQLCAFSAQPLVQRAALVFLAHCCADAALARERVFSAHVSLCELYLETLSVSVPVSGPVSDGREPPAAGSAAGSENGNATTAQTTAETHTDTHAHTDRERVSEEVSLLLKYLAIACGPQHTRTLVRTLLSLSSSRAYKLRSPHALLLTVSDLLCSVSVSVRDTASESESDGTHTHTHAHAHSDGNTPFSLSAEESAALRALITQSLHGAARESVRDCALRCVRDLLRSQYVLSPQWTLSHSAEKDAPSPTQQREKVKSFPSLLLAVTHAEMHLCGEELLYFARSAAHTDTSTEEEKETERNGESERETARRRCSRCFRALSVCCELVDLFLSLLLSDEDEETDNKSTALWASALSAEELQSVQRELKRITNELREFVVDSARLLAVSLFSMLTRGQEKESESEGERDCVAMLRNAMSRAFLSLRSFCFDDSEVREEVQRALPALMRGSVCAHMFGTEKVCVRESAHWKHLVVSLTQQRDGLLSLPHTLTNSAHASSSSSGAESGGVVVAEEMEIVFHLVVLIDVFLQDLVLSPLIEEKVALDEEAEQLLDAVLAISPDLFALPCTVISLLLRSSSETRPTGLTADLLLLLEKSISVANALFVAREEPLKSLLRTQGVSALKEILNLPSPLYLQRLHQELSRALRSDIATVESTSDAMKTLRNHIESLTELQLSIEEME